jgi:hypothetical protein
MFTEAMTSQAAKKYQNWRERLQKYWERRELWCLAWRSMAHRGHNTNNFCEVTVRLFKDIVLSRVKAYNPVALVDFVCTAMQEYYVTRLLQFAHSRVSAPLLHLQKLEQKAEYCKIDDLKKVSESEYLVPDQDHTFVYSVNVSCGVCSCPVGAQGKFCKHQAAVAKHFKG